MWLSVAIILVSTQERSLGLVPEAIQAVAAAHALAGWTSLGGEGTKTISPPFLFTCFAGQTMERVTGIEPA